MRALIAAQICSAEGGYGRIIDLGYLKSFPKLHVQLQYNCNRSWYGNGGCIPLIRLWAASALFAVLLDALM